VVPTVSVSGRSSMLRARGDEPFAFEAPDESFGFSVARTGGLQAVGMTAGAIRQINARWGIYSYAKYDRLVADPGRSPVVRAFGTRDQLSGGIALSYTFGGS
jgi:hypothetical protein